MTNSYTAHGFLIANRLISGAPEIRKCFVSASDATNIFIGDLVLLDATNASLTSNPWGYPAVKKAPAGGTSTVIAGVMLGKDPIEVYGTNLVGTENLYKKFRVASNADLINVCVDPFIVYQAITSNGTITAAQAYGNKNFDLADAGGSTVTAISGESIDVGTVNTTATLPFKVIGFSKRVGNDPTSAACEVECIINTNYNLTRLGV